MKKKTFFGVLYIGDYTILYRDYDKPLSGSVLNNQSYYKNLCSATVGGFDHCATGSPKNPSISYIFESTRFQSQWKTRVPVHIFHRYRRKPEGPVTAEFAMMLFNILTRVGGENLHLPTTRDVKAHRFTVQKPIRRAFQTRGKKIFRGTFITFSTKPPRGWPFHR